MSKQEKQLQEQIQEEKQAYLVAIRTNPNNVYIYIAKASTSAKAKKMVEGYHKENHPHYPAKHIEVGRAEWPSDLAQVILI